MSSHPELIFADPPDHPRFKNLTGQSFDKLTVLGFAGQRTIGTDAKSLYAFWWCQCQCGHVDAFRTASLTTGNSPRCGKCKGHGRTVHGCSRKGGMALEYLAWAHMKSRCYNPKVKQFGDYGGRGIYVCEQYRESFEAFLADLGPKPTPKHSIDRIDVNGSYTCGVCPECVARGAKANCRWATKLEQARNTRRTRLFEFRGRSMTLKAWADELGMPITALTTRLYRKQGQWTVEKAFTTPIKRSAGQQ